MYEEFLEPRLRHGSLDRYVARRAILRAVDAALKGFTGTLLDVGCGRMPYRERILSGSAVTRYIGLDLDGGEYAAKFLPDLTWDGKTIPMEDCHVECAMATEVLEHCPDPDGVLAEMYRVLKPGGFLFLTVPFVWPLHDTPHDQYRYTPFSLERHLQSAGFDSICFEGLGGWDASLAQLIGLWARRRPMRPASRRIVCWVVAPLMKRLLTTDVVPSSFLDDTMISGLSVTATKPLQERT